VRDENGVRPANSHNIFGTWNIYFRQLLNVHGVNDIIQRDMQTAET